MNEPKYLPISKLHPCIQVAINTPVGDLQDYYDFTLYGLQNIARTLGCSERMEVSVSRDLFYYFDVRIQELEKLHELIVLNAKSELDGKSTPC